MNVTSLGLNYSYPREGVGILVIRDHDKVLNKLHFHTSIKTGLSDLVPALSQVSNTPLKIPKGNVDLASYLYALSTAGELPSEKLITELTLCNASVNQARENLKNGRPNIVSDLINRPQIGSEFAFVRTKEINGFTVNNAVTIHASSMYLSTGSCQEHSIHTQFIHSQNCQKDEIVTRKMSEEFDHCWSESNNCVMDSWANGPAVLKKDVGSIHENAEREFINKEIGHNLLEKSAELLKALEAYGKDEKKLKAEIESGTDIDLQFWPEISVINKRLENVLNTKGFNPAHKEPISINSQIRATGVLRSLTTALGKETTIREATSGCNEVINAFNNRFRTGYLGQWHGEKIKNTVYYGEPSYFN